MYERFLNWQRDRDFEYGFNRAVRAQQGVVEAPRYGEVLKALAPYVAPILSAVVTGVLVEFLRRFVFL
jgi:hypothetical protein